MPILGLLPAIIAEVTAGAAAAKGLCTIFDD